VRALQETIIDVRSALVALAKPLAGALFQVDEILPITKDRDDKDDTTDIDGSYIRALELRSASGATCRLKPQFVVSTAGAGNEMLAAALPYPPPVTQRRPLRQMMVKGVPHTLYGHCIIADPKPRATITTHTLRDGTPVWYIGGNIAEKACKMSIPEAVQFTVQELSAIFPKENWRQYAYAPWDVDRAEPHQSVRFMPSEPTVQVLGNCALAWPTKLVFAPGTASKIAHEVKERIMPSGLQSPGLPLPAAEVGAYPWDLAQWTNV
jgi:hypothetical protein